MYIYIGTLTSHARQKCYQHDVRNVKYMSLQIGSTSMYI